MGFSDKRPRRFYMGVTPGHFTNQKRARANQLQTKHRPTPSQVQMVFEFH